MTAILYPPNLGRAQADHLPTPAAAGPSRLVIVAAGVCLAASIGAVTIAGISWAATNSSLHKPSISAAPALDSGQVVGARTEACQLWSDSAGAMDKATNAVAQAPKNWNAPETQDALTAEARIVMVESAYLRRSLPVGTPVDIRTGIEDYLSASIDMENATAHRKGTARDAAIDRANAAESKVTAACQ